MDPENSIKVFSINKLKITLCYKDIAKETITLSDKARLEPTPDKITSGFQKYIDFSKKNENILLLFVEEKSQNKPAELTSEEAAQNKPAEVTKDEQKQILNVIASIKKMHPAISRVLSFSSFQSFLLSVKAKVPDLLDTEIFALNSFENQKFDDFLEEVFLNFSENGTLPFCEDRDPLLKEFILSYFSFKYAKYDSEANFKYFLRTRDFNPEKDKLKEILANSDAENNGFFLFLADAFNTEDARANFFENINKLIDLDKDAKEKYLNGFLYRAYKSDLLNELFNQGRVEKFSKKFSNEEFIRIINKALVTQNTGILKALFSVLNANLERTDKEGRTALMHACSLGDINTVDILIKAGANHKAVDREGKNSFMHACESSYLYLIEYFLDKKLVDIEKTDNAGKSVIIYACIGKSFRAVDFLIKKGADVNAVDINQKSVLSYACEAKDTSTVINLLDQPNIDINLADNNKITPLMRSYSENSILTSLLERSEIKVDEKNSSGQTCLAMACETGHMFAIEELIKAGAKVNEVDDHGLTPLMIACKSGEAQAVERLLDEKSVDIEAKDENDKTVLIYMTELNKPEILKKFLEKMLFLKKQKYPLDKYSLEDKEAEKSKPQKSKVKTINKVFSLLDNACINTNEINLYILKSYFEKEEESVNTVVDEETLLIRACKANNLVVVKLLFDAGISFDFLDKVDKEGKTALFYSCELGHFEIAQFLLKEKEANVSFKVENTQETLLIAACKANNPKIVEMLLEHDWGDLEDNFKDVDIDKRGAFHYACGVENSTILELLKEHNICDIELSDKEGMNGFVYACYSEEGNIQIIDHLVDTYPGLNVDSCDKNGVSALAHACAKGKIEMITKLMALKADIKKCDKQGKSILMHACSYEKDDITIPKYLLEKKALDLRVLDEENKSAFSYVKKDNINILKYLAETLLKKVYEDKDYLVNKESEQGVSSNYDIYLIACCSIGDLGIILNHSITGLELTDQLVYIAYKKETDNILKSLFSIEYIYDFDKNDKSAFLAVCESNNPKLLDVLEEGGFNVEARDEKSKTALMHAIQFLIPLEEKKRKMDIVNKLIEKEFININTEDDEGKSVLHYVAELGNIKALEALTKKENLSLGAKDKKERGVFFYACLSKKKETLEFLEKLTTLDIKSEDSSKTDLFMFACRYSSLEVVKYLYSKKPNLLNKNIDKETFLTCACMNEDKEVINFLLKKNLSEKIDYSHITQLYPEYYISDVYEDKKLRKKPGLVNKSSGQSLENIEDIFIDSGYEFRDISSQKRKENLLSWEKACFSKDDATSRFEAIEVNDLKTVNAEKRTVLMYASFLNRLKDLKLLLEKDEDLDINARDKNKNTVLMYFLKKNTVESVEAFKFLVERGADLNIENKQGDTIFLAACKYNNRYILQYLDSCEKYIFNLDENYISYRKKVEGYKDSDLIDACRIADLEKIKLLIESGDVDLNTESSNGMTALMTVCKTGSFRVAEYLVNHGADLYKSNKDKETALFIACKNGHREIAELLLHNIDFTRNQVNLKEYLDYLYKNSGDLKIFKFLYSKADKLKLLADIDKKTFSKHIREKDTDLVNSLRKRTSCILNSYKKSPHDLYLYLQKKNTGGISNEEVIEFISYICDNGDINTLKFILKKINLSEVFKSCDDYNSLLSSVCEKGYFRIFECLYDAAASEVSWKIKVDSQEGTNSPFEEDVEVEPRSLGTSDVEFYFYNEYEIYLVEAIQEAFNKSNLDVLRYILEKKVDSREYILSTLCGLAEKKLEFKDKKNILKALGFLLNLEESLLKEDLEDNLKANLKANFKEILNKLLIGATVNKDPSELLLEPIVYNNIASVNYILSYCEDQDISVNNNIKKCIYKKGSELRVEVLSILLKKCGDLERADHLGRTALMRAFEFRSKEAISFLMQRATELQIEAQDNSGKSVLLYALDYASKSEDYKYLNMLLFNFRDVFTEQVIKKALFFELNRNTNPEIIKILLLKVNLTQEEIKDKDLIKSLCKKEYAEVTKMLFLKQSISLKDASKNTVLMHACKSNMHVSVIKSLVEKGADLEDLRHEEKGILANIKSVNIDTIKYIMETKIVDFSANKEAFLYVLKLAVTNNEYGMIYNLLNPDNREISYNEIKNSEILNEEEKEQIDSYIMDNDLISLFKALYAGQQNNEELLFKAIRLGGSKIISYVLSDNRDNNIKDLLQLAYKEKNYNFFKVLKENDELQYLFKGDPGIRDKEIEDAYKEICSLAIADNDFDLLKLLLESSVLENSQKKDLLLCAVVAQSESIIEFLIKNQKTQIDITFLLNLETSCGAQYDFCKLLNLDAQVKSDLLALMSLISENEKLKYIKFFIKEEKGIELDESFLLQLEVLLGVKYTSSELLNLNEQAKDKLLKDISQRIDLEVYEEQKNQINSKLEEATDALLLKEEEKRAAAEENDGIVQAEAEAEEEEEQTVQEVNDNEDIERMITEKKEANEVLEKVKEIKENKGLNLRNKNGKTVLLDVFFSCNDFVEGEYKDTCDYLLEHEEVNLFVCDQDGKGLIDLDYDKATEKILENSLHRDISINGSFKYFNSFRNFVKS